MVPQVKLVTSKWFEEFIKKKWVSFVRVIEAEIKKIYDKFRTPNLKLEENNEIESWNLFLVRFEIAAISVDFSDKVTEADLENEKKEVSKRKRSSTAK